MRAALVLVLACGCDSLIHGAGSLYVYNGNEHPVEAQIAGRSSASVRLKPERGELVTELIAGPYEIAAGERTLAAEVAQDRLTIVNLEAKACFARLDIIGMYQPGKPPVRVLQLYEGQEVIAVADDIAVPPGERLPTEAPRTPFAYQRLVVVPCHLLEDDHAAAGNVAEYVRRLR